MNFLKAIAVASVVAALGSWRGASRGYALYRGRAMKKMAASSLAELVRIAERLGVTK